MWLFRQKIQSFNTQRLGVKIESLILKVVVHLAFKKVKMRELFRLLIADLLVKALRIGLAVYDDTTVYAILDNQFKDLLIQKKSSSLTTCFAVPGDEFLQLPNKSLNSILKNFGLTEKYRAENIKHCTKRIFAT
jgi:hypothetical protein